MYTYPKSYDILVIGAGHAGIEAALAAARLGCRVAMLTQNLDTIGQLSCNPAIGGLAKGHMVREIDALGGIMGLNTDATGIQFRMLNANKGPSVRAPRAQCDKKAYQFRMKHLLEKHPHLDLHQGNVAELQVHDDCIVGVRTILGLSFSCKAVILSTGTFMRGLMHVGLQNQQGGRMGDGTSTISENLKDLGFQVERLKTGTPCRLNGRSIDFSQCEPQAGDDPPPLFSFLADTIRGGQEELFTLNRWGDPLFHVEQSLCWTTYTQPETHEIIHQNLHKSPMYAGVIGGAGPRYCPSIEDKVVKFPDKARHQIFLEPEGKQTEEYYVNGVSTSLPYEVQYAFIRSIPGLARAEIIRPGYAVEYDFCPPTQLVSTLETKIIENLYFAGQINGTSGYEEAAGQGLVAGVNAALKLQGKAPLILKRSEAYIGVMIDDLVTKGATEPYRMFTSRAEYRLLLRQDNADLRLTPLARERELVDRERFTRAAQKQEALNQAKNWAEETNHEGIRLHKWFRRPENTYHQLPSEMRSRYPEEIWIHVENDYKYAGYIFRQEQMIAKTERMETKKLPSQIDYTTIRGLKKEAQYKLNDIRPTTLGQAGRIQGVTPADLALLSVWLEKVERS